MPEALQVSPAAENGVAPVAVALRGLRKTFGDVVAGPALGPGRYLDLMAVDKKAEAGRIRFILLDRLGAARIVDSVPADALQATLSTCSTK